jgi:hypothetical protein
MTMLGFDPPGWLVFRLSNCLWLNFTCDSLDEPRYLARDRGRNVNLWLPAGSKTSPSTAQPNLRLPSNVAHILRNRLKPIVELRLTRACMR